MISDGYTSASQMEPCSDLYAGECLDGRTERRNKASTSFTSNGNGSCGNDPGSATWLYLGLINGMIYRRTPWRKGRAAERGFNMHGRGSSSRREAHPDERQIMIRPQSSDLTSLRPAFMARMKPGIRMYKNTSLRLKHAFLIQPSKHPCSHSR